MTRFFRLYEELFDLHCPDYERPTLFIFADLTSTRLSHRQQLDLLKKIGARLQVRKHFPENAFIMQTGLCNGVLWMA